jgi:hypothetical protein
MEFTPEQLNIASRIDAQVQKLDRAGRDDIRIFAEMADLMPDFKRLMDGSKPGALDELGRRFAGFYRYAKILEAVAAGIQAGTIKVPR